MTTAMKRLALVGCIASLGSAVAFGPVKPKPAPATGCTQKSCLFSFTNPAGVNQGRCGEVDAAPRMPDDIWGDSNAVREYVAATVKWCAKIVCAPAYEACVSSCPFTHSVVSGSVV